MSNETILNNKLCDDRYYKSKWFIRKKVVEKERNLSPPEISKYKKDELDYINEITGIFSDKERFENYITDLIPNSFGINCAFTLESPYFSRDDDELYFIQNPILKENTTKIPMIKGSAWKGCFSHTVLKILREMICKEDIPFDDIIILYLSYIRIFGTGSDKFRAMENEIKNLTKRNERDKKFEEALISYCLYDLGINVSIKRNGTSIVDQLVEQILNDIDILSVHKGRGIFYPTYFEQIKYEVINPHDRKKRAGKNPIFYEVVPKGTKGIFQFIYIPFDGVAADKDKLKAEAKYDKALIQRIFKYCIESNGIGAKTKLGWGLGKIDYPIKIYDSRLGG